MALSVALAEAAVRALVRTDADGGASLLGRPLPPRPLPVETTRRNLEAFLASPRTFLAWDGGTGWAPRPGATSADGSISAVRNSPGVSRVPIAERSSPRAAPSPCSQWQPRHFDAAKISFPFAASPLVPPPIRPMLIDRT